MMDFIGYKLLIRFFIIQICLFPLNVYSESDILLRSEKIIEQLIKQNSIPGLSVTVIVDNETKWSQGFGLADIEHNIKMTPDTLIRIGSISKSMTSVAITKFIEKGDMNIDDKVANYLPNYPKKKHPVTLRQLGGHLGGIRSYLTNTEEMVTHHYANISDSLNIFNKDPLVSIPQSNFHYSSYGYSLLSAAVEVASKKSFVDFMNDYLWHPLQLNNSRVDDVKQLIPNRSSYYIKDASGKLIHANYVDNSYKLAAAGMLSTTNDMGLFAKVLLNSSFLNETSKSLLFTSQKTLDGNDTGYGFGWFVDMNKFLDDRKALIPLELYNHLKSLFKQRKLFWHSGSTSGATAMLLLVPETGVIIAITSNLGGIGPQIIAASMELEAIFSESTLLQASNLFIDKK